MKHVDNITALILAGGLGTRLSPVLSDRPKVLAPVNGRPFLSYLLDQLVSAGFQDVILCTGYKGEMIRKTFGDSYKDLTIRYSRDPKPLGTGGALHYALPMIEKETILVMNGDSFCKTDFNKFFEFHLRRKSIMSIVLVRPQHSDDYGVVALNKNNKVAGFNEKIDCQVDQYINAGIYLMDQGIIDHMPDEEHFSLEYDLFPHIMKSDCFGFVSDGELIDIGTPKRLKRAQRYFAANF
ncbi:MAG: D-glycero-alpha-D-manno-heptose 1-phosphate guanylyltransferase [Desulfobacteraceae bacterium Eth-SRB1]|nr:MAG: D-glycero-alpha-D-manno-heptose 1-phosphate guanylyltransferase [Desulfobacteraceae bacterium Eth-SRB1]